MNITYKNRGMLLESIINQTIKYYLANNIALFEKKSIPTSIRSISTKNNTRQIEGKIHKKSTVDYFGVFQGTFVAFEAKSTQQETIPFTNIKDHQLEYLLKVNAHGGVAFLIIGFMHINEFHYVDITKIDRNKKSLTLNDVRQMGYPIKLTYPGHLDFLGIITKLI